MLVPPARGPVTVMLRRILCQGPGAPVPLLCSAVSVEDLQLALWICYELHYRGFDDVDAGWEWDPPLLTLRAQLEARFLHELAATVVTPALDGRPIAQQLSDVVQADDGPPLSRHLQSRATNGQFREFVAHRSVYHLKEADPHSWAIPRLSGRPKAALIEIQADEYGSGVLTGMHSELFRGDCSGA